MIEVAHPPLLRPERLSDGCWLQPGGLAAPEGGFVPLLPLGPDGIRRPSLHEARPSTPSTRSRHVAGGPQAGIRPAIADCGSRAPLAPHLARPLLDGDMHRETGQRWAGTWPWLQGLGMAIRMSFPKFRWRFLCPSFASSFVAIRRQPLLMTCVPLWLTRWWVMTRVVRIRL